MKRTFSFPMIAGSLAVSLLLLAFILSAWSSAPPPRLSGTLLPALTLFPAPTATSQATPTLSSDVVRLSTPTALPGEIAIGRYVQIDGTQGDGLRIRAAAGLDAQPLFLGFDSEIFLVKDGPTAKDGYLWWQIISPYDAQRSGWAVENYLEVIER